MIAYVMVGTNSLEKAEAFYTELLSTVGMKKNAEYSNDHSIWYANDGGTPPLFVVTKPNDGKTATFGNGTMVALSARSRDGVNKAHAKALSLGAKDEGAPGLRGGNFYGSYFRDHDGNKIAVFTMSPK